MKKLLVALLMLVMLVPVMTVAVSADNNHHDTHFAFCVYGGDSTDVDPPRDKTDTTPLYVNIQTGDQKYMWVFAMGCDSKGNNKINLTCVNGQYVSHVTCSVGLGDSHKYNIHSWIYEEGYRYATLGFASEKYVDDYITGVWSPDSQGTYKYAK